MAQWRKLSNPIPNPNPNPNPDRIPIPHPKPIPEANRKGIVPFALRQIHIALFFHSLICYCDAVFVTVKQC